MKVTLTSFEPGPDRAYYGYYGVHIKYPAVMYWQPYKQKMMKWCHDHRMAVYYLADTKWYFETEKERMLFLLRWS